MRWSEWKSSVNLLANRSCSHLGLLRRRDAVTDAWSRSDIFSCAALMRPRRVLGCGSPRSSLCNARKPDEYRPPVTGTGRADLVRPTLKLTGVWDQKSPGSTCKASRPELLTRGFQRV